MVHAMCAVTDGTGASLGFRCVVRVSCVVQRLDGARLASTKYQDREARVGPQVLGFFQVLSLSISDSREANHMTLDI